jgi:digeranylgeranylglycerophospholipid reductase
MKKKRYDVVIVGCGPCGSIAGKFAALGGAETLIVEEKRQIGFPVHDATSIIFDQSEMEEITGEKIEPAAVYAPASGIAYISPSGIRGKPYPLSGCFINRQLFQKSLAISAIRAGAEVALHTRAVDIARDGAKVIGIIVRNGAEVTTIQSSVVILAEGSYRRISRLAGTKFPSGPIRAALALEYAGVKALTPMPGIDQIFMDETRQGLNQLAAPYAPDRLSIGSSFSPQPGKERKSLKQRLDHFVRHLEEIGMYDFSQAAPVNMMAGGVAIMSGAGAAPLAQDGLLLAGDAAGELQFGFRSATVGFMAGAAWNGRVVGTLAAEAVRRHDFGPTLRVEYQGILDKSVSAENRKYLIDSMSARKETGQLSNEAQDRMIEEIGYGIGGLHLCARGALDPKLVSCLTTVQQWLKENKGR